MSKGVGHPKRNQTKPRLHSYWLCGVPLSTVSSHPYLGVKVYNKLTWANHIIDIVSKSSKVLCTIKWSHGSGKREAKETAYDKLIWPRLEYVCRIWNPHTTIQIKLLEIIQHCAVRFVKNNHIRQINATNPTATLGWPTLEWCRIIKQATIFYKTLNSIINITPSLDLLKHEKTEAIT